MRLLTTAEAAAAAFVPASTIRTWTNRGKLPVAGRDNRGRPVYDWLQVLDAEQATRSSRRGRPRAA